MKYKITPVQLSIFIVVILFGGIYISKAAGWWQTESTKTPAKYASGNYEGEYNPEDIRGSYSFSDIEKAFDIESEKIAEAFLIETENPDLIKCKDLEALYGEIEEGVEIGTGSVKLFVALYNNLPIEEGDYLPQSAWDMLLEENKLDENQQSQFAKYVIDVKPNMNEYLESEEDTEGHEEGFLINGKTTIKEILDNGVSIEFLEEYFEIKIENTNMSLKDVSTQQGKSFSDIKNKIYEQLSDNK